MKINARLLPNFRFNKITDITIEDLQKMQVRGLIIDIDNTIAPDRQETLFEDVLTWAKEMKAAGYKIGVITNAPGKRAKWAGTQLGVPYIGMAMKPLPISYLRMARKLKLPIKQIAMVGDQIFTDVRGANFVGAVSIYVNPRDNNEALFGGAQDRRVREIPVLEEYERLKALK